MRFIHNGDKSFADDLIAARYCKKEKKKMKKKKEKKKKHKKKKNKKKKKKKKKKKEKKEKEKKEKIGFCLSKLPFFDDRKNCY